LKELDGETKLRKIVAKCVQTDPRSRKAIEVAFQRQDVDQSGKLNNDEFTAFLR
jgi:Ca2+-binding EF-hand superfamily protein